MAAKTFADALPEHANFNAMEQTILEFWRENRCFERSLELSEGLKEFRFYDGPPFATGLPHYGHLLAGSLKDVVTRYAHQTGHYVSRKFGWDCHGLPVEYEIDTQLQIKNRDEIVNKIGIKNYNDHCRSIVMKYSSEWESVVERLGRWIDFRNGYKTMNKPFMESVWWVFGQLYAKGLVYKDYKVMPYSTKCATPLSNFEAGENYKDVTDPSMILAFPVRPFESVSPDSGPVSAPRVQQLVDPEILEKSEFLAWTTTPWTIPANMALTVSPNLTYSLFRVIATCRYFWVADARSEAVLKDLKLLPKAAGKGDTASSVAEPLYEWVCREIAGGDLAEMCYQPLFNTFWKNKSTWPRAWRVLCDAYVTADVGTGIVHCAPGYGEDDARVALANGITKKQCPIPLHVDDNGCLMPEVMDEEDLKGVYVKDAAKSIKQKLKEEQRLLFDGSIVHSYPHCWRSDTPLIYRAVPSWFIDVMSMREKLLETNRATSWVPASVQERRFHNWLSDARDWCVSRSRFWGTPLPLWISADGKVVKCISSIAELEELGGETITDLHRHMIDHITLPDPRGPEYPRLKRTDEVFDCWFESGSMPYASVHYPFENKELFHSGFPADFVGEGLDQTRGWFYTMSILGCALFGTAPFKNVIVNGLVLAEDGKKMSKKLKNYPNPSEVFEQFGADALRIYLISSPALKAEPIRFKKDGLRDVMKNILLPWFHSLRFLTQEVTRYEANTNTTFVSSFKDTSALTADGLNDMDLWIISMANSLVKYVRSEMTAYRLYSACNNLLQFMDQLTNWYVRLNRDRMRASDESDGSEAVQHARVSLSVLHQVLMTLTLLMAPFAPFMAEYAFTQLSKIRGAPLKLVVGPARSLKEGEALSVHYYQLPEFVPELIDADLESRVRELQKAIILGRQLRDRKRLSVKQCVAEITIRSSNEALVQALNGAGFNEYVQRELNALKVTVVFDSASVKQSCQPMLKLLGQKYGQKLKSLGPAIRALSEAQIAELEREGVLAVEGVELVPEDVIVLKTPIGVEETETLAVECGSDLLLLMDVCFTEELLALHLSRDLATKIQKLRKEVGLRFDDDANETFILAADAAEAAKLEAVRERVSEMVRRKIAVCLELPANRKALGRSQNITIFAD